jgi:hypothetical protein
MGLYQRPAHWFCALKNMNKDGEMAKLRGAAVKGVADGCASNCERER